jgi:CO dehydrogenase maturation factor
MRVAVVGKGGAGKSVIAGTMARLIARQGMPVLALDSDLLPGLSLSLGSGPDPVEPPLLGAAEQDETGQWGWREGIDATIAAQRFATAAPDGVRLLQRGKVACQGFAPIVGSSKAFWEVAHGLVDAPAFRDWTLIGDLPAGQRQTAEDWAPYAETYLVVVQPGAQSALTARRVARLARLQSPQAAVVFITNRVQGEQDVRHVEELVGERVFASLPADEGVAAAERVGAAPIDHAPDSPSLTAIQRLNRRDRRIIHAAGGRHPARRSPQCVAHAIDGLKLRIARSTSMQRSGFSVLSSGVATTAASQGPGVREPSRGDIVNVEGPRIW